MYPCYTTQATKQPADCAANTGANKPSKHKLMIYSLLIFKAEHIHSAEKPASPKPDPQQPCQPCQLAAAQATSVWADGSHLLNWMKQQVGV